MTASKPGQTTVDRSSMELRGAREVIDSKPAKRLAVVVAMAVSTLVVGCATGGRTSGAGDARVRDRVRGNPTVANDGSDPGDNVRAQANDGPALAIVNGVAIPRRRVVDLLLASHGLGVLEQIIGLELARDVAKERGLTVTSADIEAERTRSLRRLVDPLAPITPDSFDRDEAERVLGRVLAERNISSAEFDVVLERNAVLRKIVESQLVISEDQLRAEFERAYGEHVRVAHIQVATAGEVARIRERLGAGEDFRDLAIRYSANRASAEAGGLLKPFSRHEDRLPKAFREAAFSLSPGEVSDAIRIGEWFHLIRLDERLPAEPRELDAVRSDLEARLQSRLIEPAVPDLYEKLFRRATIRIHDPVLREAFDRKHPGRAR